MNSGTLNPRVTYWLVIATVVAGAVAIGMWKRMNDSDRRKMMLGLQ